MKAYPEQPSGSVMLLLTTKKFSTPNVETLKAFSRENEKILIPIKRLFLARNSLSSAKIYLVNCSK
jgi:hypothetical protein